MTDTDNPAEDPRPVTRQPMCDRWYARSGGLQAWQLHPEKPGEDEAGDPGDA